VCCTFSEFSNCKLHILAPRFRPLQGSSNQTTTSHFGRGITALHFNFLSLRIRLSSFEKMLSTQENSTHSIMAMMDSLKDTHSTPDHGHEASTQSKSPPDTFPKFPKLPAELRLMVWEHALLDPGHQILAVDRVPPYFPDRKNGLTLRKMLEAVNRRSTIFDAPRLHRGPSPIRPYKRIGDACKDARDVMNKLVQRHTLLYTYGKSPRHGSLYLSAHPCTYQSPSRFVDLGTVIWWWNLRQSLAVHYRLTMRVLTDTHPHTLQHLVLDVQMLDEMSWSWAHMPRSYLGAGAIWPSQRSSPRYERLAHLCQNKAFVPSVLKTIVLVVKVDNAMDAQHGAATVDADTRRRVAERTAVEAVHGAGEWKTVYFDDDGPSSLLKSMDWPGTAREWMEGYLDEATADKISFLQWGEYEERTGRPLRRIAREGLLKH
jgi:hypothetical protein